LRTELAQVRTDNDEFERQLGEERSEAAGLQRQLDELAAQLEAEREQYRDNSEQMQREAGTVAAGKQEIERQLEALQQEHQSDRKQLASITVEYSDVQSSLQLLRQENASLREEKSQLQSQQEEQAEQLANISQDTQMAEEVRDRLQQEWAAERDALKEELAGRSTQIDELRIRLEQSQEAHDREREHQEDLQSSITKADEQLEQNELRYTELQQEQALVADKYQAVLVERDSLREKVAETLQSQIAQQEEIEALNARIASLTETSDEASRKLNEQLQDAQKHVAEASRQFDEQVAQVESLHRDLAETREEKIRLEVETQTLQQRMEEMQLEVQQLDGRSRALDQQNQDALNKAYEDLTRKNDTEKEMQGQIERLRKKLEQTGEELLEAHNEARENTEHFREELNAERRARAEERAQLAARQKELKDQLATIAHQHEEVLSTQEGVLAQVKDSAREEQSSRLQQALLAHEQAEEQIAGLQNELARAHEETAQAVQQERERYQADLALAREQKTEADETVARIEAQLNQLMQERDAALAEQQGIREQLNSLRAEVEVARGLMGTDEDGRVADPAEMQAELDEMKKNIKIAIRLRSEAEAQRDKSLKEMIELKRQYEKEGPAGARLHVPSLDEVEEKNPQTRSQSRPLAGRGAGTPGANPNGKRPVFRYVVEWDNGGMRVWLGKAIGLGMAGIAALVFWLMLNSENPLIFETNPVARDVAVPALTAPNVPADRAETANEADRDNPAGMQADQESGNTEAVPESQTVAEDVPSQAQHALDIQDAQEVQDVPEIPDVVAGRSFRDSLEGGGKGPLMVELPAASYLMGSPGNSLNFEERPQHRVDLGAFSISKHEVSFAEYDRFARATGQRLPHDEGWGRGNQPVINVSWKNANAYVRWLSRQTGRKYRLPTESEWEFAARAGATRDHWWDPDTESAPANCFDCGSRWDGKRTTAVGSFPANRFGLHDTAGNVQEWTEDCYYPNYQDAARDGSARQGRRCTQRVVRGGSYSSPVDSLRSAKRGQYDQDTRLDNLGFRVVRVE
jgi:formylglycine-generating enzyme required for sulfatase activity